MRVEGAADTGTVEITLAFDDWAAGKVAPAAVELTVPARSADGR